MIRSKLLLAGLAAGGLIGCADRGSSVAAAGLSGPAATCLAAVEKNAGGNAAVIGTEAASTGTLVRLRDGTGATWACTASGAGTISDLTYTG